MGYQPTLSTETGTLQEQIITSTNEGSITTTIFAYLDATTILSRELASKHSFFWNNTYIF